MRPLIGITTSTLVSTERDSLGMRRFGLAAYYVAGVEEAGGLPVLLPSVPTSHVAAYVERLDGLVLSGGADVDPALYGAEAHPCLGDVDAPRDRFEIALLQAMRAAGRPILGICRGMQVANVAYGGSLVQDIPSQVEGAIQHAQQTLNIERPSHTVELVPDTDLARLAGATRVRVNSYHHQSVERLAPGWRVSARTRDGVLEAMEPVEGPFFQCVQWHPERLVGDPLSRALFRGLVEACARPA